MTFLSQVEKADVRSGKILCIQDFSYDLDIRSNKHPGQKVRHQIRQDLIRSDAYKISSDPEYKSPANIL